MQRPAAMRCMQISDPEEGRVQACTTMKICRELSERSGVSSRRDEQPGMLSYMYDCSRRTCSALLNRISSKLKKKN